MPQPLQSSLWYRVTDLKPKLRSHARLHRHIYRGQVWYLLQDPATGRINRFTPAARLVIGLMDGLHSVSALWEIANRRLGEEAPTQDEIIQLLGQLHAADLLQSDVTPDVSEIFERGERAERTRLRRSFSNPMAIRLPVWDPDAFLNRFPGVISLIWSTWGALVWLMVVLPAAILVLPHWPELSHNFGDRILAVDNLALLYLVFPVLKLFHELGHASATKARGGEVHELGVILLVLLPVPYVEASASTTFRSKYQRALVGAAGVMVELFIAAIAFYLWLLIEPGMVRALLYNVMVVAGVSTLIFNGNPLLRYDAYYILSDLTEMPNLSVRSTRYWGYLLQRYLLGTKDLDPPHATRDEKLWLALYGAASSIYRVIITVLIALFIAGRFFFIGVVLAVWAVAVMALFPVIRSIRHLLESPKLHGNRTRAVSVSVGLVALVASFLLFVPIPDHTQAEGVVWVPEEDLVRAGANGFLTEVLVQPGTSVIKGTPLVRVYDPELIAKLKASEARVTQWEATYLSQVVSDRNKAEVSSQKLMAEKAELAMTRDRVADLTVLAGTDGVFVMPDMNDLPGRYYHKGDMLGYVVGPLKPQARVVVAQDAIDRVRQATDRIRVMRVDQPDKIVTGHVTRAVPGGEELLPSRALSVEGGGEIATDPRDTKGPKAMQRMFQFDIALDSEEPVTEFGQRVYVRFEHSDEPLSLQWYRSVRLLFLSRFGV